MKSIAFTIMGKPRPKERPRRGKHGNWYTPTRTREAEDAIATQALQWQGAFTGPVRLSVTFHTSNKRLDGDNAFKLVADSLQKAGVFANDSQVKRGFFETVHDGQEKTDITVEDLEEAA